ncbi:MAG TPA: ice-binding family protein [Gemmatimonadaceae bacterium]|nr:ice-binding family protein [Gemmatimonadaceae bacterium]
MTPTPATMIAGAVQQFAAVARDAAGNIVAITPTWSVASGGGTINATTGLFTAGATAGTFTNTVRATSGTISGLATVTVTSAPVVPGALATITVTPTPATLVANGTQQFTAVGRDASNNVVSITPTWAIVSGGGTINATTGLFTAGATAGTFTNTVRATSGTISGLATVTVTTPVTPPSVNLGGAAANGIMAGTAVTCVNGGIVNANVSISPGNTITGFGPCVVTGVQNLGNAIAAQAQLDLTAAYNTLAGLACPPANFISANLGGTTKPAGVYCSATTIGVTGTLTLDGGGDPNATFVFQAGSGLTTAGDIVLINGAQAKNVYWQVGSSATIGTASKWQGNILALTSITLVDNATLFGRALARNGAVSLGSNNVITLP